jgi:outer membrane protein assembly factor BamB
MNPSTAPTFRQCLQVTALIAGLFSVVVSILLMVHYFQLKQAFPLDFPELETLKEQSRTKTDDAALREKIRHLDLVARRAWFLGLEWRQTLLYLFLGGSVLFLGSMALLSGMRPREVSRAAATSPVSRQPGRRDPATEAMSLILLGGICVLVVNGFLFLGGARSSSPVSGKSAASEVASGGSDIAPAPPIAAAAVDPRTAAGTPTETQPATTLRTPTETIQATLLETSPASPASPATIAAPSGKTASASVSGTVIGQRPAVGPDEIARHWTAFRGQNNDGRSMVHRPVIGWSSDSGRGIKWRAEVPLPGFSSPIVWKDRVFLTGGDESRRAIFAYDTNSGKLAWTHEITDIPGSPTTPPKVSRDTGFAASTPATNGHLVFAIFATGDLVAVNYDGKRVWAKNPGVPHNMYGYCSSLLVIGERLLVQYDNEDRQVLFCLEASSGEIIWHKQRESMISWSSPMACAVGGKDLIIVLTCTEAAAFDLETGEQKWVEKIMSGEVAPSATYKDGTVFLANENAVAAALEAGTGRVLWKNGNAVLPDVSSPVACEDMLFLFTAAATIGCLDAATGKTLWEEDVKQGFYSSPLVLTDRIIAFDMKGNLLVVKPDRSRLIIEHQEALGEKVLTTPALVGNRMWARGERHLYCLESPGGSHVER